MADIPQYPLMFSADQWANKYSPIAGKPFPFPASYQGPATDAHGNVIQSYLDTQAKHDAWDAANPPQQAAPVTLNTSGLYGLQPSDLAAPSALNPTGNLAFGMANWGGMMSPQAQQLYANQQFAPVGSPQGTTYANSGQAGGGTSGASGAATAAANPYDMNKAYLDALSNPGKVQTPGATVPQSASPSNQSGVLQQFLQNWNKGGGQTKGAGNYDNSGFFNALKGMV